MFDPKISRELEDVNPVCCRCGRQLEDCTPGVYRLENGGVDGWNKKVVKPEDGTCAEHGHVVSQWTAEKR